MKRAPVLMALCSFALASIACNFPGTNQAQTEATKTLAAIASLTSVQVGTSSAGNEILFQTQTAAAPTSTPPPTSTATATATNTLDPAKPTPTAGTPTQTSIAKETLKVGVEAIVRSSITQLRLRDTPTTKGSILASLPPDTRLKITDGPIAADGVLWWQAKVLTSSATEAVNKTGWVAELANGAQTIEAAR